MRKVLVLLAVTAGVAAGLAVWLGLRGGASEPPALPQDAMPGRLLVGFQDDPSLRWGADRQAMLDRAHEAGATVIRTTVDWAKVAPARPAHPTDPFDPAYRLDDVDELARNAEQRGIELLITIWGTPAWANGGQGPNRPPSEPSDLEDFAQALANRYSGRHAGYPPVRLFSAWNEPNLEQFLAPQFDAAGRSVAPESYARIASAIYDGVKRGNPDALVAIGETSERGHDMPSTGPIQDSHSPGRFARLLAEADPHLRFDAWAQHPYPPRPELSPTAPLRLPTVGMSNLDRFGSDLDRWFGRRGIPLWVTEYGHETRPADPLGVGEMTQARYAREALLLARRDPRIRMFVWFVLRDTPGNPWQSGLLAGDGRPKPAYRLFAVTARTFDARDPIVAAPADAVRLPVLELAYYVPAGAPVEVRAPGTKPFSVPLGRDGWIELPLREPHRSRFQISATDGHGHWIDRTVLVRQP